MNIPRKMLLVGGISVLGIALSSCWYVHDNAMVQHPQSSASTPAFAIDFSRITDYTNVVDVLIIGSGPAGLSAAEYAARNKLKTVLIEGSNPGGQLMRTSYVENWPGTPRALGADIIGSLRLQAKHFGAEFIADMVVGIDTSHWPFLVRTESGTTITALTVIVATGANPRTLGVEGEQQYWAAGVSTCAICDAAFYEGKRVVVVGGGDSAVEEVMQLLPHAAHVTMLVRKGALRAAPSVQERLKESDKISIIYNTEIEKIFGNGSHVTSIRIYNNVTGKTQEMPIDGVFLAIGHIPNTVLFKGKLVMDDEGYIITKSPSQKTNVPGIFAAGDVEDRHYRQAGVAAGAGIKAALDAAEFLTEHGFNEQVSKRLEDNDAYLDVHADEVVDVKLIESEKEWHQLLQKHETVVVDFYAPYCSSCMAMMPRYAAVARTMPSLTFAKMDISKLPKLARSLKITSIPHVRVYKHGQLIASTTEPMTKKELIAFITSHL